MLQGRACSGEPILMPEPRNIFLEAFRENGAVDRASRGGTSAAWAELVLRLVLQRLHPWHHDGLFRGFHYVISEQCFRPPWTTLGSTPAPTPPSQLIFSPSSIIFGRSAHPLVDEQLRTQRR